MIVTPLTNYAYSRRAGKPVVLAVVHITGNSAPPADQAHYANRAGSRGPSATLYVGRDGTVIRTLDPRTQVAWGQGDVTKPDTKNAGVMALLTLPNANNGVWETVECTAVSGQEWTPEQYSVVAQVIAAASRATGLPVNRSTVLTHRDLNTGNRPSDPWGAKVREANMARLLALALAIPESEESRLRRAIATLSAIKARTALQAAKLTSYAARLTAIVKRGK